MPASFFLPPFAPHVLLLLCSGGGCYVSPDGDRGKGGWWDGGGNGNNIQTQPRVEHTPRKWEKGGREADNEI